MRALLASLLIAGATLLSACEDGAAPNAPNDLTAAAGDMLIPDCPFDDPIHKPDGQPCSPNGAYCFARVDEETCICTNLVWSCQSHFDLPDLGPTSD